MQNAKVSMALATHRLMEVDGLVPPGIKFAPYTQSGLLSSLPAKLSFPPISLIESNCLLTKQGGDRELYVLTSNQKIILVILNDQRRMIRITNSSFEDGSFRRTTATGSLFGHHLWGQPVAEVVISSAMRSDWDWRHHPPTFTVG